MSGYLMGLAFQKHLGSIYRKSVLVKLCDHADDEGRRSYPSVDRIAAQCEMSRRSVQRELAELRSAGLIEVVQEATGPGHARVYSINVEQLKQLPDAYENGCQSDTPTQRGDSHDTEGVTPTTQRGDSHDTEGVTPTTQRGDSHDTLTVNNHQLEPKAVPDGTNARAPESVSSNIWREGMALLTAAEPNAHERKHRTLIGRWCKLASSDPPKLLQIIQNAKAVGTRDPVPYITAAIGQNFEVPADPRSFDRAKWVAVVTVAKSNGKWPEQSWGPRPGGKKKPLVPPDLVTPELLERLKPLGAML